MANEQKSGGPTPADMANAGGSSGSGGYGSSQDAVNREDAQQGEGRASGDQSRGERFDEAQGGGRGADEVSLSSEEMEFAQDQREHQQGGQAEAEFNAESD